MKFTLSWLKDHLDTDAPVSAIAETLTAIGLEVEGIENPADALAAFRTARVLTAERHPQADKLQVLTVDSGDGQPLQVVCGAPNARAGMVGIFAGPGTFVPGSGITLKKAAIRGVESNGMMCSARELTLGDDHDGIIELAADTPIGRPFAEVASLDDPLFDVNVTPNRPDCMGVNGIARDLAAAGIGHRKFHRYEVIGGSGEPSPKVVVEEASGCLLFWRRRISGVRNGASPEWLQRRLKAVGLRPISALVDITNFFSIDQARPLHVYDAAKVRGDIRVRRGREGDRFLALNGKDYAPTPDDIVIADDSGAIGFGGVMGGESTGVDETTTDVLLECALFDPALVGATGRRHGIASDARARFERGVDPSHANTAIETATQMILELCGGEASEPRISQWHVPGEELYKARHLLHRPALVRELAGVDLDAKAQLAILGRLGFLAVTLDDPEHWDVEQERLQWAERLAASDSDAWVVRVPTWRPDIDGPADLVEEIVRIHGFANIPSTPLPRSEGVAKPTATPAQLVERRVRRQAAGLGLAEAINWSFIDEEDAARFGGASDLLVNPISADMAAMRPSLIPGLVRAARRNVDRGAAGVRLFEIGRRYRADGERPTLAVLLAGQRHARHWASGKESGFDPFDLKAITLALLEASGAPVASLQLQPDAGTAYHPGRSAALSLGPKARLAEFGELHPRLAKALDAPSGTMVAELFLDSIPGARRSDRGRKPFAPPALQPVRRDFAFVVPADMTAEALLRAIRSADRATIVETSLFDRYLLDDGLLSLAIEVVFQPGERSFTDAELAELSSRIVAAAEKAGAQLRA